MIARRSDGAGDVLVRTMSPEETEQVGREIGAACRGGELIGLEGELGTGKTCLVRGLAAGLGVAPAAVRSPSFTLVAEYRGGRLPVFHIDLYRLDIGRIDQLLLREYLFGDGVAVVEWFDRLGADGADDYLRVGLEFGGGTARILRIAAHGPRHRALLEGLAFDRSSARHRDT
jgi:tRNA threonylcarbamoyladenosine biosynthesis protein TsaE